MKSVTLKQYKFLIFSDTHGSVALMELALERNPDVKGVFFLGDGIKDLNKIAESYPSLEYYFVKGNCDLAAYFDPEVDEVYICGKRIMLTHGHIYGVKHGTDAIESAAISRGANILLYGHTHEREERYIDKTDEGGGELYIFNPGSASSSYSGSYGLLTLREGSPPLFSYGFGR